MGTTKTSWRSHVLGWSVVIGALALLFVLAQRQVRTATVEIAARRPVWTAQLTGTTGDVAAVWVWTRSATLRTNVRVPAELRFDQRDLLLQVRSEGNLALALDVSGTNQGSAHVRLDAGQTNSAEFLSYYRFPFLPLGGFTAGRLPAGIPFGLKPGYDKPWSVQPSRYDAVTNLLPAK